MHEVGIAQDLVKGVLERIESKEVSGEVRKIYVSLGKEMGITEDSLKFWFENSSKDTVLEHVLLEVTLTEGKKIEVNSLEVD